jgi:hypothetical protein
MIGQFRFFLACPAPRQPRDRAVGNALATLLLGLTLAGCSDTSALQPFTTDGCSLFPDRSASTGMDWRRCCVAHDLLYWRGGTPAERRSADLELRRCVDQETGDASMATLMYHGVRLGGTPYLPTPFRWGYGWGYGRFYRPLSDTESASADTLARAYCAAHPGACAASGFFRRPDAPSVSRNTLSGDIPKRHTEP